MIKKHFISLKDRLFLKILIDYYSYRLDGFKKPKCLDVLKEVFS
ncbi:DNA repair protein RecO (recombination protein O) [Flavobacterium xinjiangense]|uniref:DNA repair protein RecO (Recombination protein O) n=1 Tax=Flavobacterium xinjiangense TaxID=178356 RepID=A0A1M7LVC0_9FLAO|nr:DNA repair protein RecO (recombination protein O) [Flavobacterium xinjiangense]